MTLQDWLRSSWLAAHRTSRQEIARLLAVADRDLHDSAAAGLSADWKFSIAYNAALQAAAAALAASGYRISRGTSHHHLVIESLAFTLGADARSVAQLDAFRKKRNVGGYEEVGLVSDQEAEEMRAMAEQLRKRVEAWLEVAHPELLGK
ncbi:MAG TPA: hypothetical protein PK280_10065 [Planctomycetota bacterium]|nr:hypothetical protein [Planctomycetota bacterium]